MVGSGASTFLEALRAEYPFAPHFHEPQPGVRMHYVDEGQGMPVVMLHGNPTWSFMYRKVVRALAPQFRCIAPDHVGCGLSSKPQDYSYRLATHIANLRSLIDGLGIGRFHLIVHDWGGAIGMGVATAMPERLGKLVVMNTAAFRSLHIPKRIAVCKVPGIGALLIRGMNAFAGGAAVMAKANPLPPQVRAGFLWPYRDWHDRVANLRFVQDIPLHPAHPSYRTLEGIEARLPLLAQKEMLLCWGMRDWCFDSRFLAEWRRRFPQARAHEFPDAAHYLLEDAGERIIPLIRDFLG